MPAYDAVQFSPAAPIAFVTLRNPGSGALLANVPMLIDTGADVSLIPQESADRLAAEPEIGQTYELVGFDGQSSAASAVELDLLFLRRAFKGRLRSSTSKWAYLGATSSIIWRSCWTARAKRGARSDERARASHQTQPL